MSHFKHVCKHGVVMAQCRCPGPKTESVVACDHPDKPDITEKLRQDLRDSLLKAGVPEDKVEEAIVDLEKFTTEQVARMKANRGREQA